MSMFTSKLSSKLREISLDEHLLICIALSHLSKKHVLDITEKGEVIVRVRNNWPNGWDNAFPTPGKQLTLVVTVKEYCRLKSLI